MNTNNMMNSTVDGYIQGGWTKYNPEKLPEVMYFKIFSRGRVGSRKNFHDRKTGMWELAVNCKDGKGLRPVTDVCDELGMKIKGAFATREEAIAAGCKIRDTWGKVKASKAPKAKETKAEMATRIAELQKQLSALLAEKSASAVVAS